MNIIIHIKIQNPILSVLIYAIENMISSSDRIPSIFILNGAKNVMK
jgi:hypothetical protein